MDIEKKLQEKIARNQILLDEPMSKHTSFRIGGTADFFVKVKTIEELKHALNVAKSSKIPFYIVGNGTNLLVKDGGIEGIVIKPDFDEFKVKKTNKDIHIIAGAGIALAALSRAALKEEIEGLEFMAGIPGTIGGAIRMNAGAYGSEMKDLVTKTKYMTYDGKIHTISLEEHKFEYRNSIFSKIDGVILETTLVSKRGNKDEIKAKMDEFDASRREKQPLEYPSAGSTFKRKEGIITAKLIDDCGLKGYSVGDAAVSTKHAGFIVNKGKATAKDVLELIDHIKKTVKAKENIDIDLEILVIGRD